MLLGCTFSWRKYWEVTPYARSHAFLSFFTHLPNLLRLHLDTSLALCRSAVWFPASPLQMFSARCFCLPVLFLMVGCRVWLQEYPFDGFYLLKSLKAGVGKKKGTRESKRFLWKREILFFYVWASHSSSQQRPLNATHVHLLLFVPFIRGILINIRSRKVSPISCPYENSNNFEKNNLLARYSQKDHKLFLMPNETIWYITPALVCDMSMFSIIYHFFSLLIS